jgi:hypothetical protein
MSDSPVLRSHPTKPCWFIRPLIQEAACVAFDLDKRHIPGPSAQLMYEWADNIKVHHILWSRMKVFTPPFAQNVQNHQAIIKYLCLISSGLLGDHRAFARFA